MLLQYTIRDPGVEIDPDWLVGAILVGSSGTTVSEVVLLSPAAGQSLGMDAIADLKAVIAQLPDSAVRQTEKGG